ncbi:hypothetical protein EV401DRAFT_2151990 [Pisolithus croceorrhizus]|nr:hypothetical protein EV401DRAFT_2151990 [Pisolithus croceorrhizus]
MDVELSDATTSITLASITIGWLPYAWKDEPFTRHHVTTYWCPDAEEHYFRILVFKCTTNPRDVTAHRWLAVVVLGHMWQPTEDGFITKTGGGVMRETIRDLFVFHVDILQTTQVLIKETLTGWENVSLRNLYKMGQPNATGALRVLCVGLPYVILDNKMYHAVPQQSQSVYRTQSSGLTTPTPPADRYDGSRDDRESLID